MRHNGKGAGAMIRRIFFAFCAITCLAVSPPAIAQDEGAANVLIPTSAWLVGPASIAASIGNIAAKIPCVVANQYNNGFVIRFSGGNNALMALAIDFKQKAFVPKQRYDIEVSVPGAFFQVVGGAAFDEGTLIFNLQKVDGLYKALQDGDEMALKLPSGSTVRFALIGLDDGFKRMETCYNPTVQGPSRLGPPVAPNLPAQAAPAHQTRQNPLIVPDAQLTPLPGDALPMEPQNAASPATTPAAVPDLLAKAQEAERIAQELVQNSPQKPKSAAPQGQELATGWTETGQARQRESSDIMAKQPGQETYIRREMRWRALKGANLREVLTLWAQGSGTELIWLSPKDFAVQRSLSQQSTFEAAAQSLLEQFSEMRTRPVGRIYREPGTSKLVLVVELSEGR